MSNTKDLDQSDAKLSDKVKDLARCIKQIAAGNCNTQTAKRAQERRQSFESALKERKRWTRDSDKDAQYETALQVAIKHFAFTEVTREEELKYVRQLLEVPELLDDHFGAEAEHAGQTPLHMAVCKGNMELVKLILAAINEDTFTLLECKATGSLFRNTAMMGQTPLQVAALTFNKGIFELLLQRGAALNGKTKNGDTVCHSLIRYGFLYPDKLAKVSDMLRYLSNLPFAAMQPTAETNDTGLLKMKYFFNKCKQEIWLCKNNVDLNPLQLSAKLGLPDVFMFIMDLGQMYCFNNSNDGLFDVKMYDVTELDAIAWEPKKTSADTGKSKRVNEPKPTTFTTSILSILFELDPSVAFKFLSFPALRRAIGQKWTSYRYLFYIWWLLHFVFTCALTWCALLRSEQLENTPGGFNISAAPVFKVSIPEDPFPTVFGGIGIFIAFLLIIQDIVRIYRNKKIVEWRSFKNPYANSWFRLQFNLLALCLIVDFPACWSPYYENYCLIFAVILSWFLLIFFLRAIRAFSFFSVLLQKVLIGDMFRFFVILAIEIIAFSTAMHMTLQGSAASQGGNDEQAGDYAHFGRVVYSMTLLTVGLGDTASIYEARHPILCVVLMITFIVFTSLLMINALIAMMGNTCMKLVENTSESKAFEMHWWMQRLSIILFLEDIMPACLIKVVGEKQMIWRYNGEKSAEMERYIMDIKSNQTEENRETNDTSRILDAKHGGNSDRSKKTKPKRLSQKIMKDTTTNLQTPWSNRVDVSKTSEPIKSGKSSLDMYHIGLEEATTRSLRVSDDSKMTHETLMKTL